MSKYNEIEEIAVSKTEANNELLTEEERLEANRALRRTVQRRRQQYEKRRRKRNRIIVICIIFSLIVISLCIIAVLGRSGKLMGVVSMDKPTVENETEKLEDEPEVIENDFASIYYYEEANMERYEAYRQQNPDMSIEDVVWRVNAYLDKPWYEYDVPVDS